MKSTDQVMKYGTYFRIQHGGDHHFGKKDKAASQKLLETSEPNSHSAIQGYFWRLLLVLVKFSFLSSIQKSQDTVLNRLQSIVAKIGILIRN